MSVYVFAGPTIPVQEVRSSLPEAVCLPPAAQGDVYRAARSGARAIGIVDGYFQGAPSVWHKELLWAMSRGAHVFGSASMGALRAAELHPFGMRGVGRVFEAFRDGVLEDDDEVAVVHGPAEAGYVAISEAMVNVRATLEKAAEGGVVEDSLAADLCALAKSRAYPDRNWSDLLSGARAGGLAPAPLAALEEWLPAGRVDLKRADARAMLDEMRRLLAADAEPMGVDYSFEWTLMWDALTVEWCGAAASAAETGGAVPYERLLDELRLEPASFEAAIRDARLRHLALREAERTRRSADRAARRARLADFREAHGLYRRADIDEWLAANGLDPRGLERLLEEEALVEMVSPGTGEELAEHVLAGLRLRADYPRLLERASRKARALSALGRPDPDPADTGLEPPLLVAWFFRSRLGSPEPENLDAWVRRAGLGARVDFYRLLAREFLYLQQKPPG